jgi:hypothetical protein
MAVHGDDCRPLVYEILPNDMSYGGVHAVTVRHAQWQNEWNMGVRRCHADATGLIKLRGCV